MLCHWLDTAPLISPTKIHKRDGFWPYYFHSRYPDNRSISCHCLVPVTLLAGLGVLIAFTKDFWVFDLNQPHEVINTAYFLSTPAVLILEGAVVYGVKSNSRKTLSRFILCLWCLCFYVIIALIVIGFLYVYRSQQKHDNLRYRIIFWVDMSWLLLECSAMICTICVMCTIRYLGRPSYHMDANHPLMMRGTQPKRKGFNAEEPLPIDYIDLESPYGEPIFLDDLKHLQQRETELTVMLHTVDTGNLALTARHTDNDSQGAALGMSVAPGRKRGTWNRDLSTDIEFLQDEEINVVVSLVPDDEAECTQVHELPESVVEKGMTSISGPDVCFRDKWVPSLTSLDQLIHVVDSIIHHLSQGDRVLVHCNGGMGRTGLVVTSVFIRLGHTLPKAMQLTRSARPGTLFNPLQIMYANWYFHWIRNKLNSGKEQKIRIK